MKTYRLIISSPDGNIFDEDVTFLSLRGVNGDLAILSNHIPFSTAVIPCTCKIELSNGSTRYGNIESGILTVSKEDTILLSSSFKWKDEN